MAPSENARIQRLANEVLKLQGRAEVLETHASATLAGVARIEKHIADQKLASTDWAKWSALAAWLGVLVSIAIYLTSVHQQMETRKSVETQVTRLQSDMRVLTERVAPELLGQIGQVATAAITLPSGEVQKALAEPLKTLEMLRSNKVSVSASDFRSVDNATANLLDVHPDSPAVWQTAAELVTYRSEVQQPQVRPDLPNCLNTVNPQSVQDIVPLPTGQRALINGFAPVQPGVGWMAHVYMGHCVLRLDDPDFRNSGAAKFFEEVRKHHPNASYFALVLNDAKVLYSGGPLIPVSEIRLTDCSFDFSRPSTVPPEPGKALTRQLLTADLNNTTVSIPPSYSNLQ